MYVQNKKLHARLSKGKTKIDIQITALICNLQSLRVTVICKLAV